MYSLFLRSFLMKVNQSQRDESLSFFSLCSRRLRRCIVLTAQRGRVRRLALLTYRSGFIFVEVA